MKLTDLKSFSGDVFKLFGSRGIITGKPYEYESIHAEVEELQ